MPQKSVYQRQCAHVAELFRAAGSPGKVLVAVLDFAKEKHLCLLCNGNGDQLLNPFPVHNNRQGLQHLLERLQTTAKRHAIDPKHVIIGGEDCPAYALNFLWALHHQKAGLVTRVNAWKAKQQRENIQASTDKLDLYGIAKTLLNRDAYLVFDPAPARRQEDRNHLALRELVRTRDALVEAQTALSNRLHALVKTLWPGFLDATSANPIRPFGPACLALMARSDFNVAAYAKMKPATLAARLQKLDVRDPAAKAAALIGRAQEALAPDPDLVEIWQSALQSMLSSYRHQEEVCRQLQHKQAQVLAATPAAVLTTMSGIGILSAAAIGGELGHADRLGTLAQMSSYAGIIPGTEQTGGPDRPAKSKKVKARCNRRLKKHLVHTVNHMGTLTGSAEFKAAYNALNINGQHADFIMSRRFLRQAKTLMVNRTVFLPSELCKSWSREGLEQYLRVAWPKWRAKWREVGAWEAAIAPEAPLGVWRQMVKDLHGIELSLDGEVRFHASSGAMAAQKTN
jgi:transposase